MSLPEENDWLWEKLRPGESWEFTDDVVGALESGLYAAAEIFRSQARARVNDNTDPAARLEIEWIRGFLRSALTLRSPEAQRDVSEEYWELVGGPPMTAEEHKDLIEAILSSLRQAGTEQEVINTIANSEFIDHTGDPMRSLRSGLMLEAAHLGLQQIEGVVERVIQARRIAVLMPLPTELSLYLQRVSRLFILGMDVEVAAMSRVTLEVALRSAITTLARNGKVTASSSPDLADLIKISQQAGLLGSQTAQCATVIRLRGNLALHGGTQALNQVGGAYGILSRLALCLNELSTRSEQWATRNHG